MAVRHGESFEFGSGKRRHRGWSGSKIRRHCPCLREASNVLFACYISNIIVIWLTVNRSSGIQYIGIGLEAFLIVGFDCAGRLTVEPSLDEAQSGWLVPERGSDRVGVLKGRNCGCRKDDTGVSAWVSSYFSLSQTLGLENQHWMSIALMFPVVGMMETYLSKWVLSADKLSNGVAAPVTAVGIAAPTRGLRCQKSRLQVTSHYPPDKVAPFTLRPV